MRIRYRQKAWKIGILNDRYMVQDSFTIGNHGVMFMGDGETKAKFSMVKKRR